MESLRYKAKKGFDLKLPPESWVSCEKRCLDSFGQGTHIDDKDTRAPCTFYNPAMMGAQ